MSLTLRQRLVGFLATLIVLSITTGLPLLLIAIDANPIPTSTSWETLPESLLAPDDGTLVVTALRIVAWAAWALMAVSLLVELAARARGVRPPQLPGLALPQGAARGLVAAAALLFITAPLAAPAAPADAIAVRLHSAHGDTKTDTNGQLPASRLHEAFTPTTEAASPSHARDQRRTRSHTVRPGESLWSIAADHLGDGSRFGEIADLNRDVIGDRPGFLRPGWALRIPAAADASRAPDRYTVRPGDTLGSIARDTLGDSERYLDIFHATAGLIQDDGDTLTDPDLIRVGWTLVIPTARSHDRDVLRTGQATGDGLDNHPEKDLPGPSTAGRDEPGERVPQARREHDREPAAVQDSPTDSAQLDDADDSVLATPWMLAGLTGGGLLLSGALLMALRSRRRAQVRARRPGRVITSPDPNLAAVEKTIAATGTISIARVEFVHAALRRLSAAVGAAEGTMPPLAAIELSPATLTLHLSASADLPGPWAGTADRTHWHVATNIALDHLGPDVDAEAPYPTLLTIGTTDRDETWLLNCEELGSLHLAGDPRVAGDLARHLAAQLAVNPWSRRVTVDCLGIGAEAATMDERLAYRPTGDPIDRIVGELTDAARDSIERATAHGVDVSTARTGYVDDDVWSARVLLLDATDGVAADLHAALAPLLQLVNEHAGQTSTAVIRVGGRPDQDGLLLRATNTGRVTVEHAGLDLLAVGLTSEEAHGCALLYQQRDNLDDAAVPIDETATSGWEGYADQTGGLRIEHTLPRVLDERLIDEPVGSLLENADEEYLLSGAATAADLQSVAPNVAASVRAGVEASDPWLDRDVADWFDADCPRPRLILLGPVNARTRGRALAKRKPYFTELLAFLALRRRHGVTRDEICDAFGTSPGKTRDYINIVRDWLGINAATGLPHLPNADRSPAARERGINVYQVDDGLLIDSDLFRRLNLRARARGGVDGHHDLVKALQLVTGRPFDQLRPGGWSWLYEGERHDEYALVAVADVAFTIVTHCLARDDLVPARAAAEIAMLAAPDEEVTRLALVRIAEAEGNAAEAQRILRDDICNRADTDDGPTELSERTETIIRNHQWLAS